jgi:hypothetical protein
MWFKRCKKWRVAQVVEHLPELKTKKGEMEKLKGDDTFF